MPKLTKFILALKLAYCLEIYARNCVSVPRQKVLYMYVYFCKPDDEITRNIYTCSITTCTLLENSVICKSLRLF